MRRGVRTCRDGEPTGSRSATGLPEDLRRTAGRRLGVAALVYAVAYLFAYVGGALPHWVLADALPEVLLAQTSLTAWVAILLSLGVFVLTRLRRLCADDLLNVGLFYSVAASWGIAGNSAWGLFAQWPAPSVQLVGGWRGVPWECVWIVMFPLIAPNRPRRILIASLASATAGPVVLLLSRAYGPTSPELPLVAIIWYYALTTYVCAFLAFFNSILVHRFGRDIREAREIGSYQLSEPLGRGGMGEVWAGRHRLLAKPAAIKLIGPEALGDDPIRRDAAIRQFEKEARATAALRSCHTVQVHDFGVTDQGSFYYVMELLDGLDLRTLVERYGPLPAGRAIYLLSQACRSLEEAHGAGLVHRDIKPANLFACRLGLDCDFVKVLDFGLVKVPTSLGDTTLLMREGLAFGTPGYLAPEAALGRHTDERVDIYALGCVAYFLVTGAPVFQAETPLAAVVMHVQEEPMPPSRRTELPIPAELDALILQCLAKDPEARPSSARGLRDRFATVPVQPWTAEDAQRWWHLHAPETAAVRLTSPS